VSDLLPSLTYREKYEELHQRAMRDPLTGLHHRGLFDAMITSQLAVAARSRTPLTVLMVDVDHFKQVNDTFGHPEGDRVLRCVARALQSATRASDFVCRFGGEEFIVLLTATDLHEARSVSERMRVAVTAECREHTALGAQRAITVSIGLAAAPQDGATAEQLIEIADRRLYDAKRSGRDRVHSECAKVTVSSAALQPSAG
jgi:diguanylate cyclase (GGDEF)-like protein